MSLTPETHVRRLPAFFHKESAPGILLLIASIAALVCANTVLSGPYHTLLDFSLGQPLHIWINDGLMVIFFLMVGLEIKKELLLGELSNRRKAALPFIGALGGMALPAIIYLLFNHADPLAARGWAVPAATDIAFAVGVISVFGKRLPASLKIFLLALAVIDDLGAVIIIALFYTAALNLTMLLLAAICVLILYLMGRWRFSAIAYYLIIGFFLWIFVLKSGVHATIAGVALGLLIPLDVKGGNGHSLNSNLEHALKPWVNFLIMPVFAFANAGVALSGITAQSFLDPVTLGILLGLFAGKQLGIFGISWLAIKLGLAEKPRGASWKQLYAVCIIAGIGFTMSLFIGLLAFPSPELQNHVKLGVLAGSMLSAVVGYVMLSRFTAKKN